MHAACGGGVKDSLDHTLVADVENVEIDRRRIVHDVGVILAGENKSGAAHIGSELIDLIEPLIDYLTAKISVAQIADRQVVCFALRIFTEFQIDAAYPKAVLLQPLDQVPADEAPGPTHQRCLYRHPHLI